MYVIKLLAFTVLFARQIIVAVVIRMPWYYRMKKRNLKFAACSIILELIKYGTQMWNIYLL